MSTDGALRLTGVTLCDVQPARVLGPLDIIQLDAPARQELMRSARAQAATLCGTRLAEPATVPG